MISSFNQTISGTSGTKINEVLRKLIENSNNSETTKTCFGFLAVLSRENANKILIVRDCLEQILICMNGHADNCEVQESGCDLLWSLAFNNMPAKEAIAKFGGSTTIVRGLKKHSKSSDFLKSACGALSNICQFRVNQEMVAAQGGLGPLVGSVHSHQANSKLLPFIFDAIASLTVGNEENAKGASTLGLVQLLVASLAKHKQLSEVVKSGCHTLAILSDVKGQASKIAFAGGVPIVLAILDCHPSYPDLHRVAAVVILRMLQESIHVAREIACNEGVRILLKSLEKGGAQQDTVAAVTHILYTVTNPSSPAAASIEPQLWVNNSNISSKINSKQIQETGKNKMITDGLAATQASAQHSVAPQTTLIGLVQAIGLYVERRDVVRAACRLLSNLSGFAGVIYALEGFEITDRLFECVNYHRDTKDVIESTSMLIKVMNRKSVPTYRGNKIQSLLGITHLMNIKSGDEELIAGCADILIDYFEKMMSSSISSNQLLQNKLSEDLNHLTSNGVTVYQELITLINSIITNLLLSFDLSVGNLGSVQGADESSEIQSPLPSHGALSTVKRSTWTKLTPKLLLSLTALLGKIVGSKKIEKVAIFLDSYKIFKSLQEKIPSKLGDLPRKIEKLVMELAILLKVDTRLSTSSATNNSNSNNNSGHGNSNSNSISNSNASKNESELSLEKRERSDGKSSYNPYNNSTSSDKKSSKDAPVLDSSDEPLGLFSDNQNDTPSSKIDTSVVNSSRRRSRTGDISLYKSSDANNSNNSNNSNNNNSINNEPAISDLNAPRHPLKNISNKFDPTKPAVRLLDNWPKHLERMTNQGYSYMNQSLDIPDRMHVVYECSSAGGVGLQSRVTAPVPYVVPSIGVGPQFEHSLTFDSQFESGNLQQAIQREDACYDLFLRADVHTGGHTQWFYFAVGNTHPPALVKLFEQGVQVPPVKVRFNITNLTKPDSLFNLGMQPVVYSCQDAAKKGIGWIRSGSDIAYYSSSFTRLNNQGEGNSAYYTLSFTITFNNPKDTVLIAYTYPYTMLDHRYYMHQMMSKPDLSNIIKQFTLCKSLGGEDCEMYVVSNFSDKERIGPLLTLDDFNKDNSLSSSKGRSRDRSSPKSLKPALFISGRVHPGEPPASWMMKGIMDFITSNSAQAQLLRQAFVIFVVPILNPDGVIYGNNRCCLAGVDLNRQWKNPLKGVHPSIYNLKTLMMNQKKIREIYMYIDLHGHSRKNNVFMYGCDGDKKKSRAYQARDFPRFLSNHPIGRKYVSFDDCSFHIKKGRESTARVVVCREMNIPYSYTLEATFAGSNYGPLKDCHMNIGHLQEVGASLCDSMLNFAISDGFIKEICGLNQTPPINGLNICGHNERPSLGFDPSSMKRDSGASSVRSSSEFDPFPAQGGDVDSDCEKPREQKQSSSLSSSPRGSPRGSRGDLSGCSSYIEESLVEKNQSQLGGIDNDDRDIDSDSDDDDGDGDRGGNFVVQGSGSDNNIPALAVKSSGNSNSYSSGQQQQQPQLLLGANTNNQKGNPPLPSPPFARGNSINSLMKASAPTNLHLGRIVTPSSQLQLGSSSFDSNNAADDNSPLSDPRIDKTAEQNRLIIAAASGGIAKSTSTTTNSSLGIIKIHQSKSVNSSVIEAKSIDYSSSLPAIQAQTK